MSCHSCRAWSEKQAYTQTPGFLCMQDACIHKPCPVSYRLWVKHNWLLFYFCYCCHQLLGTSPIQPLFFKSKVVNTPSFFKPLSISPSSTLQASSLHADKLLVSVLQGVQHCQPHQREVWVWVDLWGRSWPPLPTLLQVSLSSWWNPQWAQGQGQFYKMAGIEFKKFWDVGSAAFFFSVMLRWGWGGDKVGGIFSY